jgi:hypothetical protein
MPSPSLNDASSILDLVTEIVPKLEANWGCIIEADKEILQEAAGRARLTIDHVGMRQPNEIKQAGHYAFWLRKLKPLRVLVLDELAQTVAELERMTYLQGGVTTVQSVVPPGRRLYVNEAFALLAAIGIAKAGGYRMEITPEIFNDLTTSLRYHSFSPSAFSAILMAYVK